MPSNYLYNSLQILSILKKSRSCICQSVVAVPGFRVLHLGTTPRFHSLSATLWNSVSATSFLAMLHFLLWRYRELTIACLTFQHKKLQNLAVSDDSSLVFLQGYNVILLQNHQRNQKLLQDGVFAVTFSVYLQICPTSEKEISWVELFSPQNLIDWY